MIARRVTTQYGKEIWVSSSMIVSDQVSTLVGQELLKDSESDRAT